MSQKRKQVIFGIRALPDILISYNTSSGMLIVVV